MEKRTFVRSLDELQEARLDDLSMKRGIPVFTGLDRTGLGGNAQHPASRLLEDILFAQLSDLGDASARESTKQGHPSLRGGDMGALAVRGMGGCACSPFRARP